ncbi:hypothetical protein CPC08DRAFT_762097 [Agrocybe pediades]|nr:hypothetical protein CPC08DRAFT_762097 [Agrocybe pediades]
MSSVDAVNRARDEDPRSPFMAVLALDIGHNESGYSGMLNAAGMFLDHLLKSPSVAEDQRSRRYWECPMIGVVNICAAFDPDGLKSYFLRIHNACEKLVKILYDDLEYLMQEGSAAESRRIIASRMINYFLCVDSLTNVMHKQRVVKIALICWLYSDHTFGVRDIVRTAVERLCGFPDLEEPQRSKTQKQRCPPNLIKLVSRAVDPSILVSLLINVLKYSKMTTESFSTEIRVLTKLMEDPRGPFISIFRQEGLHQVLMRRVRKCLGRQETDIKDLESLLVASGKFTWCMLEGAKDGMDTITDLLQNTCMVRVLAYALWLGDSLQDRTALSGWQNVLDRISHCATCENSSRCVWHATPEFLDAARTVTETIAFPAWAELEKKAAQSGKQQYVDLWNGLIDALNISREITPDSIRAKGKSLKKCSDYECWVRNGGWPKKRGKKYTCKGCFEVYYCGKACQKSDWQTHKLECPGRKKRTPNKEESVEKHPRVGCQARA